METTIVCKYSAFKHGIADADIRKAFEQRLFDHALEGDEHKNLLIGFDRNGSLLEIIYTILDGDVINVFHAMKCRKAYQAFLKP